MSQILRAQFSNWIQSGKLGQGIEFFKLTQGLIGKGDLKHGSRWNRPGLIMARLRVRLVSKEGVYWRGLLVAKRF